VMASLYWKEVLVLYEKPTPAGDSRKRRLEILCQEYLFYVRLSPAW
jgi:hypothetical protein